MIYADNYDFLHNKETQIFYAKSVESFEVYKTVEATVSYESEVEHCLISDSQQRPKCQG